MPQMEFGDYVPQIFWLIIAFATLYFAMAQWALPRIADILESRQRRLDHDLESAERLRDEAAQTLAEYSTAIAGARGESALILSETRGKIQNEIKQQFDELGVRLEREAAKSEARIEAIMARAAGELVIAASDAARAVTERLTGIEVSDERARTAVDAVRDS